MLNISIERKTPLIILALIGTSLILLLTNQFGSGITSDSVAYISAARNLAEGASLKTYNGESLVLQPPLYPFLLALIKKVLSVDPMISAGYVNAFLFGFIIYSSGSLLMRCLNSLILTLLGTTAILISFALIQVCLMTLSEPLFISLIILFFHYIADYLAERNITSLIFLSVSVSLACLTRYMGVIVLLTGMISLLLVWKSNSKKYLHLTIFMLISAVPFGIWIIRNYFLFGTLTGQRAISSYSLIENIIFFSNTVFTWYLPMNIYGLFLIFIFIIAIAWLLLGFGPNKKGQEYDLKFFTSVLVFVLIYTLFIVISSTTTAYDRISNRLLSPIYIPLIIILFFIFDKIRSRLTKLLSIRSATALFVIVIILLMKYPAMNTVYIVSEFIGQGSYGYSSNNWKNNEIIQYLIRMKTPYESYDFYSNVPEAVYILSNIEAKWSPAKTLYNSPQLFKSYTVQNNTEYYKGEKYLIWFDKINRRFLFTFNELHNNMNMIEVVRLEDGGIYIFSNK